MPSRRVANNMANTKNCPGCGNSILRNASSCACGWGKPKGGSVATDTHDCAYQEHQLRCRFPGAISEGTTGQGPFYCRIHAWERGTMMAHQCLDQSQTWLARPAEEDTTWLDQNFPRQPDESQQSYNRRCKQFVLADLSRFSLKPVLSDSLAKADVPAGELVAF